MKTKYLAIFLISAATLLLELSLTRILSISFYYHFGFLVISTALLGFGISGTALSLFKNKCDHLDKNKLLFWLSVGFSLTTLGSYLLCQVIGFNPFQMFSSVTQALLFPIYNLILATPFFFTGLIISLLFTYQSDKISKLYAWDLIGAGLGCSLTALVIPSVGGVGALFIVSSIGLLTALVLSSAQPPIQKYIILIFSMVLIGTAHIAENTFPITVTEGKLGEDGVSWKPIFSEWNTMSKIEVFEMGPFARGSRYPDSLRLIEFDEGTAATEILDLRPDALSYINRLRLRATIQDTINMLSGVSFIGKTNPKVFIIGSGGGEEVLHSLYFNASKVDAVEINPLINKIVTREMADYAGYLHKQKGVTFHTEDARTFIDTSNEIYDVIISIHTISKAAIASGAMSLAEDYVLTKEAFSKYWDHLSPDGTIFFTRPLIDIPRFVTTLRVIMDEHNIKHPEDHFIIYRGGFLFKKSAFSREEVEAFKRFRGISDEDAHSTQRLVYSPFDLEEGNSYREILTAKDLEKVYQSFAYKIEPATDDNPFFSHKFRWSSLSFATFKDTFQTKEDLWGNLEMKPIAEYVLLIILLQTIVIAGIMILLPLFIRTKGGISIRRSMPVLVYFSCLGLGFIMVEMAFLQKYQLYIGQPIFTYAIILGSILVASGLGSYFSSKLAATYGNTMKFIIPAIVSILVLYFFLIPILFESTIHQSLLAKLIIAALSILPLGFLLGMPFPSGLAYIKNTSNLIPWAWGINSFFTVIGTTIALMVGMGLGFKWVLVIAGASYLLALLAMNSYLKSLAKNGN